MTVFNDEEPTKMQLGRVQLRSVPPNGDGEHAYDLHELVGKMMAAQSATQRDLQTLSREVRQLAQDLEKDRPALAKDASTHAAKHTSNRMALLVSALVVLYEQTAPVLHELWRWIHHG